MRDETDYLMRPVMRGLVTYDKLLDGSLSLNDVARMNEAIDVEDENNLRLRRRG